MQVYVERSEIQRFQSGQVYKKREIKRWAKERGLVFEDFNTSGNTRKEIKIKDMHFHTLLEGILLPI